ncbi:uncharacterized protein LOC144342274 [Saccoglossus kowalevskii]
MAKSRVTPTKQLTTPRLELTAAVTAVKISEFLKRELDYDAKHIFWTDSMVVMGYISNAARPVFLQSSDPLPLNTGSSTTALNTDDPEVKKSVVLSTQSIKTEPASFLQRLDYFSDWHRMKTSVALCIRYMQRLRSRSIPFVSVSPITVEELQHAEQLILKELQAAHFAEEHHSLSKKLSRLKGNSQLRKLDPYLAPDGLIHVGGRVQRANLPPNLKHPVVLPNRSHITSVLVRHHHEHTAHAGRTHTLNEIRANGYWILKSHVAVASHSYGWRLGTSYKIGLIKALSGILEKQSQQLDDELLITFLTEAEAIVNSRPLTYLDMSSTDTGEPLTPSQLLTQKSKVVLPLPGAFVRQDLYCRKRWRRVQYLANEFWRRWRLEYLPTLQLRQKWQDETLNLIKGDIFLVIEENTPRCQWPRTMVMEALSSKDGLVRKVCLKIGNLLYDRPITKLIMLYRPEHNPVEGASN